MTIQQVSDIIDKIARGIEAKCIDCITYNDDVVICCVQEQLWCGVDGKGNDLSPTYDDDPYFEEPGFWYHRAKDYKAWKYTISAPSKSPTLNLDPRPAEVPNLFIDGTFHQSITATPMVYGITLDSAKGNGPEIVQKYGDQILTLGDDAVEYFNLYYMLPAIDKFFKDCGYQ